MKVDSLYGELITCALNEMYTIRLKFSNFFIHYNFQNQLFENFTYAFTLLICQVMLKFMFRDEFVCFFFTSTSCYVTFKKSCKSRA